MGKSFALTLVWPILLVCIPIQLNAQQHAKLITPEVGWAQWGNHLYWTSNDGISWKDIAPPRPSNTTIGGVFFLDPSKGWTLLCHPDHSGILQFQVALTSDAGESWTTSTQVNLGHRLDDDYTEGGFLDFVDSLHGWLLITGKSANFSWGTMFATQDGGHTWASLGHPPFGDHFVFTTEQDGWLAGGKDPDRDGLYFTHDGGKTWHRKILKAPTQVLPAHYPGYDLPTFLDSKHGFLPVTYSADDWTAKLALFATTDGGSSWRLDRVLPVSDVTYIGDKVASTFANSVLIAATSSGRARSLAAVSANGKVSGLNMPSSEPVGQLIFTDSLNGWSISGNDIFSTSDGGVSWKNITPAARPQPALPTPLEPKSSGGEKSPRANVFANECGPT